MFEDKDSRDSKITDPDKYFAYSPTNVQPPTIYYVLLTDLEQMKTGKLPEGPKDFSVGGANYYKNTDGHYGGNASAAYFLFSKEVMEYLKDDKEFLHNCIKQKAIAFLSQDMIDLFLF